MNSQFSLLSSPAKPVEQSLVKLPLPNEMLKLVKPNLSSFAQLTAPLPRLTPSPVPEKRIIVLDLDEGTPKKKVKIESELEALKRKFIKNNIIDNQTSEKAIKVHAMSETLFFHLERAEFSDMGSNKQSKRRQDITKTMFHLFSLKITGKKDTSQNNTYLYFKDIPRCDVQIHKEGNAITMDLIDAYHKLVGFETKVYDEFKKIFS